MQEAAYLKIPATKLKAGALTSEQRQMIVYQALMSGPGAVAGVIGPAGEVVAVADDGSETRSVGENSWAYGVERYEVITQRLPDGALRVRTRKTETVNTTPPAGGRHVQYRGRSGGTPVGTGAGGQLDRSGGPRWRTAATHGPGDVDEGVDLDGRRPGCDRG